MALPQWLDQVPNVEFTEEKRLLEELMQWGTDMGWTPVDTDGLDFSERAQTDIALQKDDRKLRIAVLRKSRSSEGAIRIQAVPAFREAILTWRQRAKRWQIELGGVPLDRNWDQTAFKWLVERLFAA